MPDEKHEPVILHQFKNHLAIIVTYSEMLLGDVQDQPTRTDIEEIHKAATSALALLPLLADRLGDH